MNVARLLFPVQVLGPGKRLGIWFAGCPRRCLGCSNPELWVKKTEWEIPVTALLHLVEPFFVSQPQMGLILTGGEPFAQGMELLIFLQEMERYTDDILVYTGYTLEDLHSGPQLWQECLKHIGVLIDGPYQQEQNIDVPLRGSANQKIYYLKPALRKAYERFMREKGNQIQDFTTGDGVVSVGIHHPRFKDDLTTRMEKQGVILCEPK